METKTLSTWLEEFDSHIDEIDDAINSAHTEVTDMPDEYDIDSALDEIESGVNTLRSMGFPDLSDAVLSLEAATGQLGSLRAAMEAMAGSTISAEGYTLEQINAALRAGVDEMAQTFIAAFTQNLAGVSD